MAAVQFNCPHCAGLFQVDDSMSGQQVACPICDGLLILPTMGGESTGPASSQSPTGGASSPAVPSQRGSASSRPGGNQESPLYPPGAGPPGSPQKPQANRPLYPPGQKSPSSQPSSSSGKSAAAPRSPLPPSSADDLLPPGASPGSFSPQPSASSSAPQKPKSTNRPIPASTAKKNEAGPLPMSAPPSSGSGGDADVDTLLPPGAGAGRDSSAASRPQPVSGGAKSTEKDRTVLIPTEDGSAVAVRDPVKTIGHGDEAVELRQLTPEEKARRRLKKNLILWGFGLLVIGITLAILLSIGPMRM